METIMNTCWEFLTCGVIENCPAYPDHGYDCWTVEGTLCGGERQGGYTHGYGQQITSNASYKYWYIES